jgi:hypothetical protein
MLIAAAIDNASCDTELTWALMESDAIADDFHSAIRISSSNSL